MKHPESGLSDAGYVQWLKDNGGTPSTTSDISGLEYSMLRSQGAPRLALPDMWKYVLGALGYTGGIADMQRDFWEDGGVLEWSPSLSLPGSGAAAWSYFDTTVAGSVYQHHELSGGAPTGDNSVLDAGDATIDAGTLEDQSGNGRHWICGTSGREMEYVSKDGVSCVTPTTQGDRLYVAKDGTGTAEPNIAASQVVAITFRASDTFPTVAARTYNVVAKTTTASVHFYDVFDDPNNWDYRYNSELKHFNEPQFETGDVVIPGEEWKTLILHYVDATELNIYMGTPSTAPVLISAGTIDPADSGYTGATAAWTLAQSQYNATPGNFTNGLPDSYYCRGIVYNDATITADDIVTIHDWLVRPLLAVGAEEVQALPSVAMYIPIDAHDITARQIKELVSGTEIRSASSYPDVFNDGGGWENRGTIDANMTWGSNYLEWDTEIDAVFKTSDYDFRLSFNGSDLLVIGVYSEIPQHATGKGALIHAHLWGGASGADYSNKVESQQNLLGDIASMGMTTGPSASAEIVAVRWNTENSTGTYPPGDALSGDTPGGTVEGTGMSVYRSTSLDEKGVMSYSEETNRDGPLGPTSLMANACHKHPEAGAPSADTHTALSLQSDEDWDELAAHPDEDPGFTPWQQVTFGGGDPGDGSQWPHFHGYVIISTQDAISEAKLSHIVKFCTEQWSHRTAKALPKYLLTGLSAGARESHGTTTEAQDGYYLPFTSTYISNSTGFRAGDLIGAGGNVEGIIRFPDIGIPQGATIIDAELSWTVDSVPAVPTANHTFDLYLEDADDATPLADINGSDNPTTWAGTTAISGINYVATGAETEDLTTQVGEVITDRAGWVEGNALNLFGITTGTWVAPDTTGIELATPVLKITWTAP